MRRIAAPLLLALACGPRSEPAPAQAAAAEHPAPSQAVPEDRSEATPAQPELPAAPQFHIAARGDDSLTLRALGEAVAVFDLQSFAVAAPPTAPLAVQPARVPWSGVFEAPPGALGAPFSVEAVLGGRWPDAVMITVNGADDRAYPESEVLRFDGKRWKTEPLRPSGGLRPFYADYAEWRDGAPIALRLWATTEASSEYETEIDARPDDYRAALVRLDAGSPRPPELPLDASLRIVRFSAARTGAISAITDDGRVLRWTPTTDRWDSHPAPKLEENSSFELFEGPDDALWLSMWRDQAPLLQRLSNGTWSPIAPPRPGWARSLAHDGEALWVVFDGARGPDGSYKDAELWRADTRGELRWQAVPLPSIVDPSQRDVRLSLEHDSWSLVAARADAPPDDRWPIRPRRVVAAGGAVWVEGRGPGGGVALVDRPVAAVLERPRPQAKPADGACTPLFLSLLELPPDAEAPPAIAAVIESQGAGEVALVIARTDAARVLGAAWLPSLIHHGESDDEESRVDRALWRSAKAQLTKLGEAVAVAHAGATPTVHCWAPEVERLVWLPESLRK